MTRLLIRRRFLQLGPLGVAGAGVAVSGAGEPDGVALMAAIEQEHGGRLGVFARETGSGATIDWRADEPFPMASTFKAPLAALALKRVQDGTDTLHTELRYGSADLIPVSPVTTAHLAEEQLSIATLVSAILERSDNTAANLLLRHVGGPAALTAFLRRIGDQNTTIRRGEVIGASPETDNTTTPRAFATTLLTLCTGSALQPELRNLLLRGMANNQAGRPRLRGGFPNGWRIVDRTGTEDGICNDGAIAWPPQRAPIVVSVFHDAPGLGLPVQEALQRRIGRLLAKRLG